MAGCSLGMTTNNDNQQSANNVVQRGPTPNAQRTISDATLLRRPAPRCHNVERGRWPFSLTLFPDINNTCARGPSFCSPGVSVHVFTPSVSVWPVLWLVLASPAV